MDPVRPRGALPGWVPDLLAAVSRDAVPVEVDDWAPSVQGAVGHVVGVRGRDGTAYVLKAYARVGGRQAATEARALQLLADLEGIPVPRLVHHGKRGPGTPRPYLLVTRLPGVRWADRRAALDARSSGAVHRAVGRLLRRLHVVPGDWFGDLLPGGATWPTAWARADARCTDLVERFVASGGPRELGRQVRAMVDDAEPDLASCEQPVLCHLDLTDGNLVIASSGPPQITGVVDLERAGWDDPLADLARTRLHARGHDEIGADALVKAYGLRSDEEQRRLAVHEVLHAVEERTWVATDRPAGWRQSAARLDAFVRSRTSRA